MENVTREDEVFSTRSASEIPNGWEYFYASLKKDSQLTLEKILNIIQAWEKQGFNQYEALYLYDKFNKYIPKDAAKFAKDLINEIKKLISGDPISILRETLGDKDYLRIY